MDDFEDSDDEQVDLIFEIFDDSADSVIEKVLILIFEICYEGFFEVAFDDEIK